MVDFLTGFGAICAFLGHGMLLMLSHFFRDAFGAFVLGSLLSVMGLLLYIIFEDIWRRYHERKGK